jgi:hypothetical protein
LKTKDIKLRKERKERKGDALGTFFISARSVSKSVVGLSNAIMMSRPMVPRPHSLDHAGPGRLISACAMQAAVRVRNAALEKTVGQPVARTSRRG